jgi:hypothetical protein
MECDAEFFCTGIQGLLQIYSVQVDEWGAILCADILVKGGFVGEDLTGIAMDGERRGLSCGLPDGVG